MPKFYVIDGDDNTLWAGKDTDDGVQTFKSFEAAERRAKAAAETEPAQEYKIVSVVGIVACDISKAKTRRV